MMLTDIEQESAQVLHQTRYLNRLRQDGQLCDVILMVNGQNFPAHRCILASSSSYFEAMFTLEMKEKYEREVVLKNMDAASVEHLLHFMYTGEVSIDKKNFYALLEVASLTQTKGMLKRVGDFMETLLQPSTCLELLQIAIKFSLHQLKKKIDQCILKNFEEISENKLFMELSEEDLATYLKSDGLRVDSEEIVYEALVRWVKHEADSRREKFPVLLAHIRLQYVLPGFLSDTIRKETLVRTFPECRDMVDDTFDFHLRPAKYEKQRQRLGTSATSDSLLYFETGSHKAIALFDGLNKTWSKPLVDDVFIREGCAVASSGQRVAFCGGRRKAVDEALNDVTYFDEDGWKFDKPRMINPRLHAAAAFVNANLFVFGGRNYVSKRFRQSNAEVKLPDFVEMLDSSDNRWKIAHSRRYDSELILCAAVVVKEKVYLLGGAVPQQQGIFTATSDVLVFNTKDFSMNSGKNMNYPRADFGGAASNNKIFVCGGLSGKEIADRSNVEFMDCETTVWTNLTTKPPLDVLGAGSSSACWLANQIAVVYSNQPHVFVYDPLADTWESIKLQDPLINHKIVSIVGFFQPRSKRSLPLEEVFDTNI